MKFPFNLHKNFDYFLGIPLCFFLYIPFKVFRIFRFKKDISGNALLIHLTPNISPLCIIPALDALLKEKITPFLVISKQSYPEITSLLSIDNVNVFTFDLSSYKSFILDFFKFILWATQKNLKFSIDLTLFSRLATLVSAFSGAKFRIGFYKFTDEGLWRGNYLTHKVLFNRHLHISENYLSTIHAAFSPKDAETPFSKISLNKYDYEYNLDNPKLITSCKNLIEPSRTNANPRVTSNFALVLSSPLLEDQFNWGFKNSYELIEAITNYWPDATISLACEYKLFSEITTLLNISHKLSARLISYIDPLESAREIFNLDSKSIFITTNISNAYLSAGLKIRTLVIYGPESPKISGPLSKQVIPIYKGLACSPCFSYENHRNSPCADNVCLKSISAKEVISSLRTLLAPGN